MLAVLVLYASGQEIQAGLVRHPSQNVTEHTILVRETSNNHTLPDNHYYWVREVV